MNSFNIFFKIHKKEYYYNDYYNVFQRENEIDYFLAKIDYNSFILNSQDSYEAALKENEMLSKKLISNPSNRIINKKLNSDKTVVSYKNDIAIASKNLNKNETDYIAGALVIKRGDMATILISGYDKNYSDFAPNYFLYYEIINYYKGKYKRLDLNGITGDFSKQNKFYGLNQFKIGFNPNIYEYIGEFDLVINKHAYNTLYRKGYLAKEFDNK